MTENKELTALELEKAAGGGETYSYYSIKCKKCGEILPISTSTVTTLEQMQVYAERYSGVGCPLCSAAPMEGLFEPVLCELTF